MYAKYICIGIYTTRLVHPLIKRHETYVYIYRFVYEKYIYLFYSGQVLLALAPHIHKSLSIGLFPYT